MVGMSINVTKAELERVTEFERLEFLQRSFVPASSRTLCW